MAIQVLDPTHEGDSREFSLAPRLSNLQGATVGIISNGKQGTGRFFDALSEQLQARGASSVVRLVKPNYSAPAPADVLAQAQACDAIISGIGDWGSCSSCSLHDAIAGDNLGKPSAGIMTTQFVSAADMMARVLGAPDYRYVVIDHPISSASTEQLQARAGNAVKECIAIWLGK